MGNKRKNGTDGGGSGREKRTKTNSGTGRYPKADLETPQATSHTPDASADPRPSQKPETQSDPKRRPRIRKLAPARPFPTVAASSSATGPRSTHHEGKNNICVTRKTKLAAYLRRCKTLLVEDGFKELRLDAMGAAIPHLALLTISLPPILPWGKDEVHVDVLTGSAEVHDEVLSESEEEDGPQEEFRTRVKSTMNVIIRIGQGETPGNTAPDPAPPAHKKVGKRADRERGDVRQGGVPEQIVLEEPEQDGMETSWFHH